MIVAWVRDCTKSESHYVNWLVELRSGSSKSKIVERVSLDPEAERWVFDKQKTFPGGIMESRRGELFGGVSESVGGRGRPPGTRLVKVAPKGSRK